MADSEAVLDGGLPHYDSGGLHRAGEGRSGTDCPVSLLGTRIGRADGRTVTWDDVTVLANGEPVTGLALWLGRDRFGAKLVGEDVDLDVGERVTVEVRRDE